MKKQLVASLAAAMVLGIAGTSFAAANPFVDVPAKHWAYDSVTKLAQAGIVDGYSNGQYQGDKVMSRYEMAQIVAKAMAKSDKADAGQKAIIDKLSVEFASELEGLNVRVTKIEKNASSVKITGEARIRYDAKEFETAASTNTLKLRTRLHLTGNINDQWMYYGRLESVNNLRGESDDGIVKMDNVWVKGPILGTTATIGRFDYVPNYGMVFDSTLNGVNFAFGNVVKANVFYGKERNGDIYDNQYASGSKAKQIANKYEVTGLTLKTAISKVTNLTGGYYELKANEASDKIKVGEVGFDTKLDDSWTLKASYGESSFSNEDKAMFAEIGYKGANKAKVGSYGAWVNYRNLEANAVPRTTFDNPYANGAMKNGGTGYEVGFSYTPMLNAVMKVKYSEVKSLTDNTADLKTKHVRAQVEFYF